MFKLYVLLVPLFRAYGALLYTSRGHNVTLSCFYAADAKHLCWYKQVAGEQPRIISSFYKHSPDSNSFHNQFKDSKRFSVDSGKGFYHLNISNVQDWDSAMYYCGQTTVTVTQFNKAIFLLLKESSRRSFLQQPASDSVKPGGYVALNCTVHAGPSGAEHSVYWFKEESRDSPLGIIYVHARSSGHCAQSLASGSPAQSCVYTLWKRNVSLSDAGTYHCAVASSGEIVFGKGTRLDVGGKRDNSPPVSMLVVAALLVSVMLNIILIGFLCKMSRRKRLHSGGLQPLSRVPECTADSQTEESDALQYVALDFSRKQSKSRRQRSAEEDTVYSGIRLSERK